MPTSKNTKVYSGYPFVVKANAKGFYDYHTSLIANKNRTFDVNMETYQLRSSDFINVQQDADVPVTIQSAIFETPDYDQLDKNTTILKDFSENKYWNVPEKILDLNTASCSIEGGILSGLNTSSKCELVNAFPELTSFKMIINATIKDVSTVQYILFGRYPDQISGFDIVNSRMTFYDSSTGDTQGTTELVEGKTYWFALNKENDKFVAYLLEQTEEFNELDQLPEFTSNWSKEFELSSDYFSNKIYCFGCSDFNTSNYWRGSINLNKTLIEANESVFFNKDTKRLKNNNSMYGNLYHYVDDGSAKTLGCWFAKNESTFTKHLILTDMDNLVMDGYSVRYLTDIAIPEHDLYGYSETISAGGQYKNYTLNGDVEVSDELIATTFGSSSNYLSMDCQIPSNSMDWEFVIKVNSDSYSSSTRFLASNPKTPLGIALGCNNSSRVWVFLSSDGSNYDIAQGTSGTKQLEVNKDYWVKLAFNGSKYIISISEDGQTFVEDFVVESTLPVYSPDSSLVIGVHDGNCLATNAKVYLKDTYLKVDNSMFWKIEYKIPKWVKK